MRSGQVGWFASSLASRPNTASMLPTSMSAKTVNRRRPEVVGQFCVALDIDWSPSSGDGIIEEVRLHGP